MTLKWTKKLKDTDIWGERILGICGETAFCLVCERVSCIVWLLYHYELDSFYVLKYSKYNLLTTLHLESTPTSGEKSIHSLSA